MIISLKSVLALINVRRNGQIQDTVWQSGRDKAAEAAMSLLAIEPAFDLICYLFGVFFYGCLDPWIHGSDWSANGLVA